MTNHQRPGYYARRLHDYSTGHASVSLVAHFWNIIRMRYNYLDVTRDFNLLEKYYQLEI